MCFCLHSSLEVNVYSCYPSTCLLSYVSLLVPLASRLRVSLRMCLVFVCGSLCVVGEWNVYKVYVGVCMRDASCLHKSLLRALQRLLFRSRCLSLCLSLYLSLFLCICFSVSAFVSVPLCLSLYLCICPCVSAFASVPLSLCFCVTDLVSIVSRPSVSFCLGLFICIIDSSQSVVYT